MKRAADFIRRLRRRGLDVVTSADVDEHSDENNIASAELYVVWWSDREVGSEHVRREARLARKHGVPIAVILLTDKPLPEELRGAPIHRAHDENALRVLQVAIAEGKIAGRVLPPLEDAA